MNGLTKYEKILIGIFLITLPFINPWVRGDGVGYYAFARAPLIEHDLNFQNDWMHANASFRMSRFNVHGDAESIDRAQFTTTGHLDNHFSVGPAILWSPFLITAHALVKVVDAMGAHVPADGFSRPYRVAMAFGTALYGFAALWISFRLARRFAAAEWAFFATLGIWFASSLPVYMYFNPSWSHAQSAFAVTVVIYYLLYTKTLRRRTQWLILGLLSGLMMDIYYINAVLLLLPFGEALGGYYTAARERCARDFGAMAAGNAAFGIGLVVAFLPTLITKKIIYGSFFDFGYGVPWHWSSPAFFRVLFSADHGFLAWTPILALAVIGLVLLARQEPKLGIGLLSVVFAYTYAIGCYGDWDGLSSFGNRFFVSLTPIFVIGLAAFCQQVATILRAQIAAWAIGAATSALILLNFGLIFQWGTHLIPARGPISFREAARNEVTVVPQKAAGMVKDYLTRRSGLMERIEQEDVDQLKSHEAGEMP